MSFSERQEWLRDTLNAWREVWEVGRLFASEQGAVARVRNAQANARRLERILALLEVGDATRALTRHEIAFEEGTIEPTVVFHPTDNGEWVRYSDINAMLTRLLNTDHTPIGGAP